MPPNPASVFDEPMLLARVGGNRTLARGLLREFYVTHADVVHRVRAALGAQALDDAFRLLHRTAGTAANLGLVALAGASAQAEDTVRAAVRGDGDLGRLDLEAVEGCLHQALAAIQRTEERLARGDSSAAPEHQDGGDRRRADLIARLDEELRANDLQALDTAATLAPLLGPGAEPLTLALARLDFAEAAGILGGLTICEGAPRCQSSPPPERC